MQWKMFHGKLEQLYMTLRSGLFRVKHSHQGVKRNSNWPNTTHAAKPCSDAVSKFAHKKTRLPKAAVS